MPNGRNIIFSSQQSSWAIILLFSFRNLIKKIIFRKNILAKTVKTRHFLTVSNDKGWRKAVWTSKLVQYLRYYVYKVGVSGGVHCRTRFWFILFQLFGLYFWRFFSKNYYIFITTIIYFVLFVLYVFLNFFSITLFFSTISVSVWNGL